MGTLFRIIGLLIDIGSIRQPEHRVTISGYRLESGRKFYYMAEGKGPSYELALQSAQSSLPPGFIATGNPTHFQSIFDYSPREKLLLWARDKARNLFTAIGRKKS